MLAKLEAEMLILGLRGWWDTVEHPYKLAPAAAEMLQKFPDMSVLLTAALPKTEPLCKPPIKRNIANSTSNMTPVHQT
jgi:hypothetical protein